MPKDLLTSLAMLRGAQDGNQVEEALKDVSSSSPGSSDTKAKFLLEIERILGDDSLLNAKLRRKVKRLQEMLTSAQAGADEQQATASSQPPAPAPTAAPAAGESLPAQLSGQSATDTDTPAKSLAELTEAVRATMSSAADLVALLADVRPGIGTCHTRRTLKRAIEATLKRPEIESSMNANTRRRIARVLKILGPGGSEGIPSSTGNASQSQNKRPLDHTGTTEKEADEAQAPSKKRKVVPYVVFVGQLSFETSEAALEAHVLKNVKLQQPFKVRMLTDADSQKPKGIAFIETSTAEDLYALLTLHHSTLDGRRINVERSCGGSDSSKRTSKLEEKRKEQSEKMRAKCEQVLQEYSTKGVLDMDKLGGSFREKLLNCTPQLLSSALRSFEKLAPQDRSLTKLDKLVGSGH